MNAPNRQSEEFFEGRYLSSTDPWQFASSAYELNRYQATLDCLSRPRYSRAFEPACSVGVLTAALARRVDRLIACDISGTAISRARERCRDFGNIEFQQRDVAAWLPEGPFDLIVFSELGYYFPLEPLKVIVRSLASLLDAGGEFVAVHWLGHSADHVLHGDEVHEVLSENPPGQWLSGSHHPGFRIDSWRRSP